MSQDKHPIGPVLEHYGGILPNRQGWTKMRCPFHDDSHASAQVSLKDNAFICFGCGIKGDTYSLIMEQDGVGFFEAKQYAENITGTSITSVRGERGRGDRVFGKSRSVLRGREKRSFGSCS